MLYNLFVQHNLTPKDVCGNNDPELNAYLLIEFSKYENEERRKQIAMQEMRNRR